jgi:hypothetical protein
LFVPIPAYFIFGTGSPGVFATFLILILIFMIIFYRLASKLTNPSVAVVAVVVTSTMPLTIGLSRYFVTEFSLMILTITWIYMQLQSGSFLKRAYIIPLGIILGLGMLMKVTFPIYISGPILWGFVSAICDGWSKKNFLNILANSLCILAVGLLISSTWYLPNLYWITHTAFDVGYGSYAKIYSMGEIFNMRTLFTYWQAVINGGISSYYFLVLLLLFGFKMIEFVKRQNLSRPNLVIDEGGTPKANLSMLLIWFFVPFIIFSFSITKDIRFLLPAFPALGIIIAQIAAEVLRKEPFNSTGKVWLMLVFPCMMFGYISIPSNINVTLNAGPLKIIHPQIGYTNQPLKQDWKQNPIIDTIEKDSLNHDIEIDSPIGVIPNHDYFNALNFTYYAVNQDFVYQFEASSRSTGKDDLDSEIKKTVAMEYVIIKTGDEGRFAYNSKITPLLLDGRLPFTEIRRFALPDGSEAIIYRKNIIR